MSEASESIGAIANDVSSDLACRGCGYNLRSIEMSGQCPECGLAVEISTRSDQLRHANPNWLLRLLWGFWLVLSFLPHIVVTTVLVFGLAPGYSSLLFLGKTLFLLITLSGAWLLGTSEPSDRTEGNRGRTEVRLRTLVVVFALYVAIAPLIWATFTARVPYWSLIAPSLYAILQILVAYLVFARIAAIAERIPNTQCRRVSLGLKFGFVPIMAIGDAASVLMIWYWRGGVATASAAPRLIRLGFALSPIASLIAGIVFTYLLVRMIRLVGRAHEEAKVNWNAVTAQSHSSKVDA